MTFLNEINIYYSTLKDLKIKYTYHSCRTGLNKKLYTRKICKNIKINKAVRPIFGSIKILYIEFRNYTS